MAEIRIPEEYRRGFIEIRELDDEQAHELISALSSESPTLDRSGLRSRVAAEINNIARSDIDQIMEALISLYTLRESMGTEPSAFVDIVCEAMDESGIEELEFEEEEERQLFKARLEELLTVDPLNVATKANDLLYEAEHTIHGPTRVITDIRPVFGDDPEEDPVGTVIVHTLKISYHDGRRIEDFYVTLDTNQVDQLTEVLGRASLKAESLKRMLASANTPYIDSE